MESSSDTVPSRGPHGEMLTVISNYGEQAWSIAEQYHSRAVTYWNYLPPGAKQKAADLINQGIENSKLTKRQANLLVSLGNLARRAYKEKDKGNRADLVRTAYQAGQVVNDYIHGDATTNTATHQGGVSIEPIN